MIHALYAAGSPHVIQEPAGTSTLATRPPAGGVLALGELAPEVSVEDVLNPNPNSTVTPPPRALQRAL